MIGRKPEGLTWKQYERALDSFIHGGMQLVAAGLIRQGMNLVANIPRFCWELTRPGTTWVETDLTDKLDGQGRKYIQNLTFISVIGEDGKPIVGFAEVFHHDGTVQVSSKNLPPHISDQVQALLEAHEEESGYDMTGMSSLNEVLKETTAKTIDKQVEEFTKELDDLNKMWQGGGD